MGGTERHYVDQAFDTNWIAPLGPNVDGFEQDLSAFTGSPHVAALTTGTAALHLGLILSGVTAGDEVICQSFTFSASANPIVYLGAKPVFVDSEKLTWNMDPELLEEAILDRIKKTGRVPKAIVPVHLYGMPAQMNSIMEIANRFDITVIEDAAEALGSHIDGKMCGTFGRFGILSFNGNKIITTSGGGALIGPDEALIQKARFLATQARDPAPHYEHSEIGYNYRLSNVSAGIGRGQMEVLPERIKRRREIFTYYRNALSNGGKVKNKQNGTGSSSSSVPQNQEKSSAFVFPAEPEGYYSNRWLTTLLVNPGEKSGITREDIRLALDAELIEARPLWKPMHRQPV
ncbi:MAG: DegT/DnrJ/EryC1/StrS family aminotransferase, partial [Cyclonatronaceae bacterium]